ncbi:S26 family signal peptidase [Sphingomonas sp. BIUV-7]|uniref:S26 family signal peptidase n=1 Tax=Sphingomonas natans TaxID=3063330 RepID=A0ABT8YEP5_9SPHN|nr:S26 family signal peptidase [Sphingomonas sp. BIUV-7]MDO6416248.1 S26 family signal peptidase [Sphingomonas sp. BIUV-7]
MRERRDLGLFGSGNAVRGAPSGDRRVALHAALISTGCAIVLITIVLPPLPRLIWNASSSAPTGLYQINPTAPIATGDIVVAHMPADVRALAAGRHYIPAGVPLVKRVAASNGDRVCALGSSITINGRRAVSRRTRDASARALPQWRGCVSLGHDALLLLMTDVPDSFDGRYFGPTQRRDVLGRATALWLR